MCFFIRLRPDMYKHVDTCVSSYFRLSVVFYSKYVEMIILSGMCGVITLDVLYT